MIVHRFLELIVLVLTWWTLWELACRGFDYIERQVGGDD